MRSSAGGYVPKWDKSLDVVSTNDGLRWDKRLGWS